MADDTEMIRKMAIAGPSLRYVSLPVPENVYPWRGAPNGETAKLGTGKGEGREHFSRDCIYRCGMLFKRSRIAESLQ
jgi:hypothetical protein